MAINDDVPTKFQKKVWIFKEEVASVVDEK